MIYFQVVVLCQSYLIPDISKWNINKVRKINGMFNGCSSLLIIPDISKWNTENLIEMNQIIYGCSSLLIHPDFIRY